MDAGPALVADLALAGAWLVAGPLSASPWARRRVSAAAGVSVAYVFIDVLPELELQREVVAGSPGIGSLLGEQRLYLLVLASFVVMYGLEHMVLASRQRGEASRRAAALYGLQLAGYAAYSGLIGYLVVERAERGIPALAVYTFAMALHFLIVDHSLAEEHAERYTSRARWLLASSTVAGWAVAVAAPLSEVAVARLFAVLAGGVVITSLRAELPDDREGRFWPFCLAALAFALVLLLT